MIVCCGEALIDMLPLDQGNTHSTPAPISAPTTTGKTALPGYIPHTGGASLNSAIALGRLGCSVGLLTGLSTDHFGEFLAAQARANGICLDLTVRTPRPTPLAFVHYGPSGAHYTFYDDNSAGRGLTQDELPTIPDDVGILFFGGISLAVEPSGTTYTDLAIAQAPHRLIMVDPNIRPNLVTDAAAYRARLQQIMTVADIIKISDEDLDWLVPGPQYNALTGVEKLTQFLGKPPQLLLHTRGSEGAIAHTRAGVTADIKGQRVDVVDTVGAGDTFNAGILAQLSQHHLLHKALNDALTAEKLHDILRVATAAASISVTRAGANPPTRDELTKWTTQATDQELNDGSIC